MTVTIAALDELQFGDLGDAIADELAKRLGYMQDRDAKYLYRFVQLLEDSGISGRLATTGSDSTKSLVGRTLGRRGQLDQYSGSAAPGWLWKQTTADVLDTIKAAQAAGIDTKDYLSSTGAVLAASVPASSLPAPVATMSPSGAVAKAQAAPKAGAPLTVKAAQADMVEAPYYAAHATDLVLPSGERRSKVWQTVKDYALPIGIVGVGLVGAVVIAVLERKRAPAVAGLAGVGQNCGKKQRRWILAEKRAHRAKLAGNPRRYRKAEKASERAYERGRSAGCPWAR